MVKTIVWSDPLQQIYSSLGNVGTLLLQPVDFRILGKQPVVAQLASGLPTSIKDEYGNSRQSRGELSWTALRRVHVGTVCVTLIVSIVFAFRGIHRIELLTILWALLWNAFVTGSLSGPMPRYQERVSWVLTLIVIGIFVASRCGKSKQVLVIHGPKSE